MQISECTYCKINIIIIVSYIFMSECTALAFISTGYSKSSEATIKGVYSICEWPVYEQVLCP